MSLRGLKVILQTAVCAVLLAVPASAVTINPNSAAVGLAEGSVYEGSATHSANTTFTDYWNFSLIDPVVITITTVDPNSRFTNLTALWWNVTDGVAVGSSFPVNFSEAMLSIALSGVGKLFRLEISGATKSVIPSGAYTLSVTTTPIPPALLLFGSALAGLGFLGRRSRRSSAASPLA